MVKIVMQSLLNTQLKKHLFISPESDLGCISNQTNKFYKCNEIAKIIDLQSFKFSFETYKREM